MEVTWRGLLKFPRLLGETLLVLVYLTLTEEEHLLIGLFSVVMGIILGPLWGLAIFFGVTLVLKFAGDYVSLIASKIGTLAQVIHEATRRT